MKFKFDAFNALVVISSLFSFIVTLAYFSNFASGYKGMIILPILFLILYCFIFQSLRNKGLPFTVYGIIIMQWIRFVLMPPVCAAAGENVGFFYINPMTESIEFAILMMIYEMLAISVFSLLWFNSKKISSISKRKVKGFLLSGNMFVYLIFILLAIIIVFSVGKNYNLLHFGYIPIQAERLGDMTDTYLVLARQIVIIALFLIFLWTVNYCKIKYEKTSRRIYVDIAIIIAIINVAIIVGERRTAQIYSASISMWILLKTFPMYKKRIFASIGTMALIVLSLMSIYKFFAAFQYGSYIAALSNSNADAGWLSRTLQSYFFGPENIASTIEFSKSIGLNISNMIFDLSRSTFGISFLLKGKGGLTSELFNTYIYGKPTVSGHLISGLGYGYIYFGALLSPVIVIINIIISSKVEKKLYESQSYEMVYLIGYIVVRFSTNLFINTAPLINYSTMLIGTAGLLFLVAKILKFNNGKNYYSN